MKSAVRRSVLLSIPALVLTLGACGINEQTQGWYPRYDGVTAEAGTIGLRNVVIIASTDGRATVLASFANQGDADQLEEIRLGDSTARPEGGPLEIPRNGFAALGPGGADVQLDGVELTPGRLTEIEFRFSNAPRTTLDAIVKEAEGRYADVTFAEPDTASDS